MSPSILWFGRTVVIHPQCMGYRSLIALFLLAMVCSLRLKKWSERFKLVALSVPIAVIGNILRIAILLGVCLLLSGTALSMVHDVLGYVIFVVEVNVMANFASRMSWRDGR